jgi:hypothetical protein
VRSLRYKAYPVEFKGPVIVYVVSNGALIIELGYEFSAIVCSSGKEAYSCGLGCKGSVIV